MSSQHPDIGHHGFLAALFLVLCACAEDPALFEVRVGPIPPEVRALQVQVTLTQPPSAPRFSEQAVAVRLDRFLLRLPMGEGQLSLQVRGRREDGCAAVMGSAKVAIKGLGGESVFVDLSSPVTDACQLRVARPKGQTVRFLPPGAPCTGATQEEDLECAAYPAGTGVEIQATPDSRSYFAGWSGECAGTAGCQVLIGDRSHRVHAHFSPIQVCTQGFCWENPLPQGNGLRGVWVEGEKEAFAIGLGGTVLRWSGERWFSEDSGSDAFLLDVTGDGNGQIFVVGERGTALHFDGLRWQRLHPPTESTLFGVSAAVRTTDGLRRTEVWMVGTEGTLLRYQVEARAWQAFTQQRALGDVVVAVRAFSERDVWAATRGGLLLRFDGSSFTVAASLSLAPDTPIHDLWGTDGAHLWMVGGQLAGRGLIVSWDGRKLTSLVVNEPPLISIWGSSPDDIWIVGEQGAVLHSDGTGFQRVRSPTTTPLLGVASAGPRDAWAVGDGGTVMRWNGVFWEVLEGTRSATIFALWGGDGQPLHATDRWGNVLEHLGSSFARVNPFGAEGSLQGISTVGEVWGALTSRIGTLTRWNAATKIWQRETVGGDQRLFAVAGNAMNGLWAVGNAGAVFRTRNGAWERQNAGTSKDLRAVWIAGPDDVWITGADDTVIRYRAGAFQVLRSAPGAGVAGVQLRDIWGSGPDDLWFVGTGDAIRHFDGTTLREIRSGTTGIFFNGVWGRSRSDVWITGSEGRLLHHDGRSLSLVPTGIGIVLYGAYGLGSGDLWIFGEDGAILHRAP